MNYFHVIRFKPDSNEKQLVLVTHKVKDFAAWLKVFDGEGSSTRASNGLVDVALSRGIADSNLVHLVFDIKDMAKAKARMKDPALKKLMTDGGVIGTPKFEFYNIAD
jgi:quinol monooxygenase YgiN